MKLTLNLPPELAERLRKHLPPSDRPEDSGPLVERILELGLEVSEAEDDDAVSGDVTIPESWRIELDEMMARRRRQPGAPEPPTDDELDAYADDRLDPESEEAFLERLVLHPDSVADLVERMDGDDPTADDSEVAHALEIFRARLEGARGRRPARRRWLDTAARLAAVVLLAVGALWIPQLYQRIDALGDPAVATPVEVATTRSSGTALRLSEAPPRIALMVNLPMDAASATVIMTDPKGEEILRQPVDEESIRQGYVTLVLVRDRLRPGSYRIVVVADGDIPTAGPMQWLVEP